jgi:hypothetical protein
MRAVRAAKSRFLVLDKARSSALLNGHQPAEQLRSIQLVMTVEEQDLGNLP